MNQVGHAKTSSPVALDVQSVGVLAGSRWIVRDVTFDARGGEVVAIIGPNGAGKTTLLEAIVGLRHAKNGSLRVNGQALRRFTDFARSFSFLPDAATLPPETTVRTLVDHASSLSSLVRHFPGSSGDHVAGALRRGLALDPLLGKPVAVLSRGEHQRVALYCTLVLERPIAVLDEPFSAFDPLQLRSIFDMVREIAAPTTAIVASIHQLADAEQIANRILILAGGRSIAFGDLASLRQRARDEAASLEGVFVSLLAETDHAP
jgi:ABC-type multidrug transport system ATPase subunit